MPTTIYISHPEIVIEPAVPVPEWRLNDRGRARAASLASSPLLGRVDRIVTSDERKALDTTELLLADRRGLAAIIDPATAETDRSVPGFAPPEEFERQADSWFAHPAESPHGWETAVATQRRIVEAHARACEGLGHADVLVMVGHGGVGTLLWCAHAGEAIDRIHDQRGAGHLFEIVDGRPTGPWRPFESADDGPTPELPSTT